MKEHNHLIQKPSWNPVVLQIALTLQIQSGKCCALSEFLIKLWSMCITSTTMHSILVLLTTTWLETHQVQSTFRFEFARSMQSAVLGTKTLTPFVVSPILCWVSHTPLWWVHMLCWFRCLPGNTSTQLPVPLNYMAAMVQRLQMWVVVNWKCSIDFLYGY